MKRVGRAVGYWLCLAVVMPVICAATESPERALGKKLFFDPRLSADGTVSCSTCHRPDRAFSDGLPVAAGIRGRTGTRNTPSLLDVGLQRSLFWDGRRTSLEAQALDPLLNPAEHGLVDEQDLLARVQADAGYVQAFQRIWRTAGEAVTAERVAQSLAAFQRTLVSGPTPLDRFLDGDATALNPAARRGWQLFADRAQCTRCHTAEGKRPLFTDHQFHTLAVGLKSIERKLPQLAQRLVELHQDGRAFDRALLADPDIAALGRFAFTLVPDDIGKFKTPPLRNVALTAPYMHDGSVATLAEAVDAEVYYRGTQDGRPLILTPSEREDLVAFLNALTSDGAGSIATPRQAAPQTEGPIK